MTPQLWADALALPLFLAGALAWRRRAGAGPGRDWMGRVARRPGLAIGLAFAAGCAASAVPALLFGPPIPQSHDEFCYLLQADTFASGRLTNPTPPLPRHFENLHQLLHPTYTGKYHPAQALVLAAGQAATGSATVGLWLQVGLLGAALVWMLGAFLPPRWALGTALASVLWLGAGTYWGYSYWGGCVPAAAGAVVFGAAWRLAAPRRMPRWGDGAMLGLGLAALALSRPFEGLLVGLTTGVLLLAARDSRRGWLSAAGATAVVLGLGLAWMLLYNRAVTGHALEIPYLLYDRDNLAAPTFVWQPAKSVPPSIHPELERYHQLYVTQWRSQRSLSGWLRTARGSLRKAARFFFGPSLWLPLLALRGRDRAVRFALATIGLVIAGVLSLAFFVPHYLAPIAPLVALLVALGLRRLRAWRRERATGKRIAAGVLLASCGALALNIAALGEARRDGWGRQRVEVAARLESTPGRDLVFVEFGGGTIDPGWVYNRADLEAASIVWARSMSAREDCELMSRLPGRRIWRLEIRDLAVLPRLTEQPGGACAATPV